MRAVLAYRAVTPAVCLYVLFRCANKICSVVNSNVVLNVALNVIARQHSVIR